MPALDLDDKRRTRRRIALVTSLSAAVIGGGGLLASRLLDRSDSAESRFGAKGSDNAADAIDSDVLDASASLSTKREVAPAQALRRAARVIVRDADTGQIISGAKVRASFRTGDWPAKSGSHSFVDLPLGNDSVHTIVSPKAGSQGEYALIASHPSYTTEAVLWRLEEDSAEHGPAQIDIALKPARQVTLRVVNDRGLPIQGAMIYVYSPLAPQPESLPASIEHLDQVSLACTDKNGQANLIINSDFEELEVRFEHENYQTLTRSLSFQDGKTPALQHDIYEINVISDLEIRLFEYWVTAIYVPDLPRESAVPSELVILDKGLMQALPGRVVPDRLSKAIIERTPSFQDRSGRLLIGAMVPERVLGVLYDGDPISSPQELNGSILFGIPEIAAPVEVKLNLVPLSQFNESSVVTMELARSIPPVPAQIVFDLDSPAGDQFPADFDPRQVWIRYTASGKWFHIYMKRYGGLFQMSVDVPSGEEVVVEYGKLHLYPGSESQVDVSRATELGRFVPRAHQKIVVPLPVPKSSFADVELRISDRYGRPIRQGSVYVACVDRQDRSVSMDVAISDGRAKLKIPLGKSLAAWIRGESGFKSLRRKGITAEDIQRGYLNIILER